MKFSLFHNAVGSKESGPDELLTSVVAREIFNLAETGQYGLLERLPHDSAELQILGFTETEVNEIEKMRKMAEVPPVSSDFDSNGM